MLDISDDDYSASMVQHDASEDYQQFLPPVRKQELHEHVLVDG